MTPAQVYDARRALGDLWGLGRPLTRSELGAVLRLRGRDPGATVRDWEAPDGVISGPASVALELLLAGGEPPDGRPAA